MHSCKLLVNLYSFTVIPQEICKCDADVLQTVSENRYTSIKIAAVHVLVSIAAVHVLVSIAAVHVLVSIAAVHVLVSIAAVHVLVSIAAVHVPV